MFYHGSAIGGLIELRPFISEHKKPYIYFSTNPVVALLYCVRPLEKPFSWYPYGFDGDTVVYSEYYPNAFEDVYKGNKGYLYECENVPNTDNPTSIKCAYTCENPVKVDGMTEIPDVYDKLKEYQDKGLFRIKPFYEISEKEMQMVYDDLLSTIFRIPFTQKDRVSMSTFIKKNFRELWEQVQVISHYNALIHENNDPVRDVQILRDYMDKWDGQVFIDELQLSPDKSVLELGVGTGRLAVRICNRCKEFTGIDISPKTIERAGENLKDFAYATLICADFMNYSFGKPLFGSFDVVYSSLTFMHIQDKQKAIRIAADLLKPNGRFVLSTDKSIQTEIDYGNRKITVYPDKPEETAMFIKNAGLSLKKQFETEFAVIFVAVKER